MPPKISVVMPVYNAAEYLKDSIPSVLAQDFTDFELVAVDDKSTDSSLKVLRALAKEDTRIRVIAHKENTGIVGALNTGIEHSKGSLIARMDGDDYCMHGRFEDSMPHFSRILISLLWVVHSAFLRKTALILTMNTHSLQVMT